MQFPVEQPLITRLPTIYAFAANPWHGTWMNRQQLLSRLASRGWPVIYSTGPMSVWDRGTDRWSRAPWLANVQNAGGVLVDNAGRIPPRWPKHPRWDQFVIRQHGRRLSRIGRNLSDAGGIAYLFHPQYLSHLRGLGFRYLVYHAFDALALTPGWSDSLANMEQDLIERADLIVGSSGAIIRDLPEPGPRRAVELPNGADAVAFAAAIDGPCPDDLAAIPRPRLGYIGRINQKVDFNLICEIARRRPDWHWVLVGPVQKGGSGGVETDPLVSPGYKACCRLANVHLLGPKSPRELPAYTAHMDINTMCYRQEGGWWVKGYPLKLHEYLASGKPIVSANLETMQLFSHVIALASTVDEWLAVLERSLSGDSTGTIDERQAVAFEHTWDRIVERLEQCLLELLASNGT